MKKYAAVATGSVILVLALLIAITSMIQLQQQPFKTYAEEDVMPYITYKPNQKQTTFKRISPVPLTQRHPTTPQSQITRIPTSTTNPPPAGNPPTGGPTPQPDSPTGPAQQVTNILAPLPPNSGMCQVNETIINCTCATSHITTYYICLDNSNYPVYYMNNHLNGQYYKYDARIDHDLHGKPVSKQVYETGISTSRSCEKVCQIYDKPVLYLYPPKPMYVDVVLQVPGTVIKSIPEYGNGWRNVLAYPDGTLFYKGKKYTDLFYETQVAIDASTRNDGFLLQKESLTADLSPVLSAYGLQGREYTEFLDYWVPRLQKEPGPAFFMRVLTWEEKNKVDLVLISPKPDTFIHFLAEFYSVPELYQFQQQQLPAHVPARKGFTVVEWGGSVQ